MIILLRGAFLLKSESKCTANDLQSFEKERLRFNPVFDSSDTVCVSRSCAAKAGRASRTQIIFVLISLSDRQYVTPTSGREVQRACALDPGAVSTLSQIR